MKRYRSPAPRERSLARLVLRSILWFVVLLALLVAGLLLWRHFHGHEKVTAYAASLSKHSTTVALVLLLAAFVGAMLVTWSRARAQALGLLGVIVLATGALGGVYVYGIQSLDQLKATSPGTVSAETQLSTKLGKGGAAVALIAGYDHRAGTGSNSYAGSNSDTLMLLRVDPTNDTLSLLSFPRDLNVPIYCNGNAISTHDRVNAAWADCGTNGGPRAALDTIKHLAGGLNINYLITLDFNAFQQIVDRLGGVYLNVDRRYYNPLGTGWSAIDLHPGYQRLNGADALSYVRFRHLDSDIYRNGRQQLFMEALKARLKSSLTLSNFKLIPRIIKALKGNLEIAKADGTAPTIDEVNAYLGTLISLPPGHLIRNAIPPLELKNYFVGGADELTASPQAIAAAVHRFLHPALAKVRHHHHHSGGNGTKTPSLPHKDVSVLVLNAGNITGEAADTSYKLGPQGLGFDTKTLPKGTPANAPSKAHDTVVYYDPSQANGQKAAEELAALFRSHTRVAPMTSAIAGFAQQAGNPLTVVAIGTTYTGRLKVSHAVGGRNTCGSTRNAQVTSGIPVTLSAVHSEDVPAHFGLMLPHEVAAGSSLSTMEGVRLFKPVRGKQELVLTFNLYGGVEYWQVEESNWTQEPLLASPTAQCVYRGRTLKEFTSGGAIQEVAVYQGHSVYWVQNTILNALSNSTMLAIAEGLQPLR